VIQNPNVIVVMLLLLVAMSIMAIGSVTPALISRLAMALLGFRVLRASHWYQDRRLRAPISRLTHRIGASNVRLL
jgi:hypothetical protein